MRKEWKKSLLVFKMSQRSLFECGISKKRKADESDLADNAEFVPTSASSDQPQPPTKKHKPLSATPEDPFTLPRCLVRPVWLAWIRRPVKTHVLQMSCREKQEHFLKWRRRCVYFCGVNAHFQRCVRLKNKKTRKDLMQIWKFKTKKKKKIKKKIK